MKNKILFVFFIHLFILNISQASLYAVLTTKRALEEVEKLAQPTPEEELSPVIPKIEYKAEGLRDPFQTYLKEEKETERSDRDRAVATTPPPLTIQGIIWGAKFPQAIINNKVVKVGDTIEGARILDIGKDGIKVFYNNRQFDLSSPASVNLQSLEKKPEGGQDERSQKY